MALIRTLFFVALWWCAAGPAIAQDAPFVRDVFDQINAQRTQHGLKPCTYNKTLEKAAQAHAEWMARSRKMDHLQDPPASFEEHATCNHHPINRAINAGYVGWDEVFRVEKTSTGAVVHARPGADDHVGEIVAAGWGVIRRRWPWAGRTGCSSAAPRRATALRI